MLAIVVVLICATSATADDGDPRMVAAADTTGLTQTEELEVIGRGENLVGVADAASEGRVGQDQIEDRPFLRPGETLEVVPGLIATQHSGTGKANQWFLRGFNLDHGTDFGLTVEGVPINLPTHAHGQGYLDVNFLIPELIEVIRFEKGPYHADVGDFSSAGAAQLQTMSALPQGLVSAGIGQDNYWRGLLADSPEVGGGRLLYALEAQYYDGPWEDPENLAKFNGELKYTLGDTTDGLSIAAFGYTAEWDSTDQIPRRAVQEGLITRLGTLDPTDGGKTLRAILAVNGWRGAEDRSRFTAYVSYYRLNLFSNFTYFLDDPVNGDQFEQADRRIVAGGQASQELHAEIGGFALNNTFGLQLRSDFIPQVGLYHTQAQRRLERVRDDTVNETSLGLYAKSETPWTDWLRSTVGLRGDVYYFSVASSIPENSGNEWDGLASPKLGLVFGPWSDTELYANAGLGFHSNDARGTTIRVDPKTGEPATPVDPLVRTKGAEIGARTAIVHGLQSTVALWWLDVDSEILFVGDAGTTEPSRPSRRYGLELANYWKPLDWLALDADVSLSHAEFRDQDTVGDHIPGSVEAVVSAGAALDLPSGFMVSLRSRYFGPRALIEDDSVRSESTLLTNLRAGWTYQNLGLHLDVLNLFDSTSHDIDYWFPSRISLDEPAEGVDDLHFHPAEPREIRGYVTYRF